MRSRAVQSIKRFIAHKVSLRTKVVSHTLLPELATSRMGRNKALRLGAPQAEMDGLGGAPVLRLEGVTKTYGAKVALDDITLNVPDNAYVALLGSSGSGKTVLLRTIAGFETLDRGSVLIQGQAVNGVPAHRRNIGFVFQNFALFPHLDVVREHRLRAAEPRRTGARAQGASMPRCGR